MKIVNNRWKGLITKLMSLVSVNFLQSAKDETEPKIIRDVWAITYKKCDKCHRELRYQKLWRWVKIYFVLGEPYFIYVCHNCFPTQIEAEKFFIKYYGWPTMH